MVVAPYIEELTRMQAPASVKQHLAAIRMLFDWRVVCQVLPFNPASSVRGPKHVVKEGKTPVLSAEEARGLLDGIDLSTLAGLRDRALPAKMIMIIFGGIAEFERSLILTRTQKGREAVQARGVSFGHPSKLRDDQKALARDWSGK